MGDVIPLVPDLVAQLLKDESFITDMARFQESLLTEKYIRKKYGGIDAAGWSRLGESEELISRIEEESIRRQRSGQQKREAAQKHVSRAPEILNQLMTSPDVNPRHRIDSAKELNNLAADPAAAVAGQMDRFIITINLNGDVEHYNKAIAIDPNDTAPAINIEPQPAAMAINTDANDVDSRPQLTPATTPAAATNKALEDALASLMLHGD